MDETDRLLGRWYSIDFCLDRSAPGLHSQQQQEGCGVKAKSLLLDKKGGRQGARREGCQLNQDHWYIHRVNAGSNSGTEEVLACFIVI